MIFTNPLAALVDRARRRVFGTKVEGLRKILPGNPAIQMIMDKVPGGGWR